MPKKKINLATAHLNTGKVWDESAGLEDSIGKKNKIKNNISAASLNDYREKLEKMNKFDLEKYAISVYVTPRDNRDSLIAQLLKEFSG